MSGLRFLRHRLAPCVLLLAVVVFCAVVERVGLRFNLTASLPLGLYRQVEHPVALGDLVAVCPAEHWVRFGRARGYLPPGRCAGGGAPLLKRVVATVGQMVELTTTGVELEGRSIQEPAPTTDGQGRALEPLPDGRYLLGPGELWLAADDPRSFDSRYFGPVHRDDVISTIVPVWTRASTSDPARSVR